MKYIILYIYCSLLCIGEISGKENYTIPIQYFRFAEQEQLTPNTFRIPFKNGGRLIIVQATVDGQTGNFIFDTGAEDLVLNANHFSTSNILSSKQRAGITGMIGQVYQKQLDTFYLESYLITNKMVDALDMSHIETKKNLKILGLLGAKVYKDFEIMIDYGLKQLTFSRTNKKGGKLDGNVYQETPQDSMDIKVTSKNMMIVNAMVGKKKLKLVLDTGAEFNLLHHRVNRKVLDYFKIQKRVRLSGASSQESEVFAGVLEDVICGPINCQPMRTLLMNMDQINETYRTQVNGVLGFEFLIRLRVAINYKKKRLYFYQRNFRP